MKIYKKSDKRVLAELDRSDIERYKLDFNRLSLDDGGTRLLLSDLALMSAMDLGVKARLHIDALVLNENCIFVAITLISRLKHYKLRKKAQNLACRLYQPQQLYRACEAVLLYSNSFFSSQLLFDGNSYTLLISLNNNSAVKVQGALLKFGKLFYINSAFERAVLLEHNKLICEGFIEKLLL